MNTDLLYGSGEGAAANAARYPALAEKFSKGCGMAPEKFFSSPGRAEILGNHTDHNLGRVIVSAISCDIIAAVKKRDDGLVEICSDGFYPIHFNIRDTAIHPGEEGRSYALARGVAEGIKLRGYMIGGFTAYTESTVFRGAGVSSSAAFEVLVAEIFNVLYCGGKLTPAEKAEIGKYAENEYFGKPSGLLDQTGVALGGMNKVDFANPSAPISEKLLPPKGYKIVITNAGGNHASLTDHYAAIKDEMSTVSAFFGKRYLREVNEDEFYSSVSELKKKASERAILRAIHYFDENRRVDVAAEALKSGDVNTFLNAVNESGESSLTCLQNAFVPGSEIQPIPLALKLSHKFIKDGAVRLHGGGFAGTVIAFVSDGEAEPYAKYMSGIFGDENVFTANVRGVGACEVK